MLYTHFIHPLVYICVTHCKCLQSLTRVWENLSISKSMRMATPDRPTPALQWTTVVESDGDKD